MVGEDTLHVDQNQGTGTDQKLKTKRYNLILPINLFNQVQTLADEEGTSALELLKRFIRIGLIITKLTQSSDAALVIRQNGKERELVLL
jgi:hypothetical protein